MAELDLDAARAARSEAKGHSPQVKFGGERFSLPAELPWDFFEVLDSGDMKAAMGMLLNGDFDRFWAHGPTTEDMKALARGVPALYGFGGGAGESSASAGSSSATGKQPRRTSPTGTRSTSVKRSGGRTR